jgi:hypothetical protein
MIWRTCGSRVKRVIVSHRAQGVSMFHLLPRALRKEGSLGQMPVVQNAVSDLDEHIFIHGSVLITHP